MGALESQDLAWPLGIALGVYVIITYALGLWVKERVNDAEDFLVAGRRLSLPLAWATLLATWFGAGTMLTAADEVRHEGLRAAALEPLGSGLCLVLAGLFFARRLWDMKLLTVSDFFRQRFGPRAELLSALIMVPGYFGWIAVQFIALAGMLELGLGLDIRVGIALVAVIGMGYTLLGGMWAVTLTDALQLALLLIGLLVLGGTVLLELGDGHILAGFAHLADTVPAGHLVLVPTDRLSDFVGWLAVLSIAALGNLPGQDLMQRVFASRSALVAKRACILAGVTYILFGTIPVLLGLSAPVLFPGAADRAIVPALAQAFLSPPLAITFALALASAVLSTIDSAILSPSSVLAQNVFPRIPGVRGTALELNRYAVLIVTGLSLIVAYVGEDAYELLEGAYELGLVGLFVPLAIGVYRLPRREAPGLAAMAVGTGLWLVHQVAGWDVFLEPFLGDLAVPVSVPAVALSVVAYLGLDRDIAVAPLTKS